MDEKKETTPTQPTSYDHESNAQQTHEEAALVNSSGHIQEIDRTFGIFSICSLGVLVDNAWGAGAGSLVISLYNGGGPGVIYGLIASVFFYSLIAAGLAELASAIPSSANVYHWASVTAGPKYGRTVSFFAGWWNALAWMFAVASVALFSSQSVIAMYSVYHPAYEPHRWHFFIAYVIITWLDLSFVLFGQRILALSAGYVGAFMMLIWFVITMVCAILPSSTSAGYASNAFVWTDFQNLTGWSSNGLVFVMGMLNGSFAIGTPDGVVHLCEEIPQPKRNIPWGILCQMTTGAFTAFCFYTAIGSKLYGVTDLNAVFESRISALPLAGMFQQVTRSDAGTFGLLFLYFLDQILVMPAVYVMAGRMLWTLARDEAVPFSHILRRVDAKWRTPFYAQIVCGCGVTILGAIFVGNEAAFTAIVGSFTIFTTWSYCAAMLPHLLTGRQHVKRGPFWMPAWVAYPVVGTACAYILIFDVIFMFPYSYPTTVATMNYSCVMCGGLTIILAVWYLWKRNHGYIGPKVALDGAHDDTVKGVAGLTWEEEEKLRKASASGGS